MYRQSLTPIRFYGDPATRLEITRDDAMPGYRTIRILREGAPPRTFDLDERDSAMLARLLTEDFPDQED